jgi:uncharacterized protein (UPF0179 family)
MGTITLAGRPVAKEGAIFRYSGKADECDACGLVNICHKLRKDRYYKVVKVRDVTHPCAVHIDDKVYVVEVEELPLELSVPQRKALEAALVTLDEPECSWNWCPNHSLCTVPEDLRGIKVKVDEVKDLLECPRGLRLKRTIVRER